MATYPSILAWRIPWTGWPGRLQCMGSWGVGHDWATQHTHTLYMPHSKTHVQNLCCTDILMEVGQPEGQAQSHPSVCILPTCLELPKRQSFGAQSLSCAQLWCQLKVWGVPKIILRFDHSLEQFIELTETYYTHDYGLLQGNDTDKNQQKEEIDKQILEELQTQSFCCAVPWSDDSFTSQHWGLTICREYCRGRLLAFWCPEFYWNFIPSA